LIIDEAGKISVNQLQFIHELRDLTEKNLGIILSGPEYFHTNLKDWSSMELYGIPELYRRIAFKIWLERPKQYEIEAVCNKYGINDKKLIIDRFSKHDDFGSLTADIIKYLTYEQEDEDEDEDEEE
jgi:hypothetical protein